MKTLVLLLSSLLVFLTLPVSGKDKGKLHSSRFNKSALKHTKKALRKISSIQSEVSFKTGSVFEFGPYYPDKPPQWSVKGLYQNQEWDVYPKLEEDETNSPPYFDFDHSSTKPPPPPMMKTISKEKGSE